MAKFFSEEEIKIAKDVDLVELLSSVGIPLKKHSGSEFCHINHDSLKISRNNGWYWNSRDIGGNAIDYFIKGPDYNLSFTKAVELILTSKQINIDEDSPNKKYLKMKSRLINKEKSLYLPTANVNNNRITAYLTNTRGIDYDIIQNYIKAGLLYESSKYHNCVFLGKDYEGNIKYASERGTISEKKYAGDLEGSDKNYGFRKNGNSETVHVFESAIDLLSYETINIVNKSESDDTLLSLGCVSTKCLDTFLNSNNGKKIQNIFVRTDNDKAGRDCAKKIQVTYGNQFKVIALHSKAKDYNEDLLAIRQKEEFIKIGFEK